MRGKRGCSQHSPAQDRGVDGFPAVDQLWTLFFWREKIAHTGVVYYYLLMDDLFYHRLIQRST